MATLALESVFLPAVTDFSLQYYQNFLGQIPRQMQKSQSKCKNRSNGDQISQKKVKFKHKITELMLYLDEKAVNIGIDR